MQVFGAINYTTQYHDMAGKRYAIYYSPQKPPTPAEEKGIQELARQLGPGYQLRTVYDLDTFMELVRIWQEGLDDAVMLVLRLMLCA